MTFTFAILAVVTLAGAIAAMSLRNLVHCALCLVASFGGLAGLTGRWLMGVAVAALTYGSLMVTIVTSALISPRTGAKPNVAADISVKNIGAKLMTDYVLPLEVVGLLLTAALIGAVIIAMEEQARHAPEGSQSH
ncbi:MAG: hypothetical protein DME24_17795 [Verrucomicrobia bacterium]|nr:MAG: hypothetical protein DME24_17795 [Verrucomicrobiota bacterium]